jgi:hypothetical protein
MNQPKTEWTPAGADVDPEEFSEGLISPEDFANGEFAAHSDVKRELDE